jgi:hypothetical protein
VRTSHQRDVRARTVVLNREALRDEYNDRVLPQAIAADQKLINVLKGASQDPLAAAYESEAAKAESPERRRYCLDIARELYFLHARDAFYTKAAGGPYPALNPARNSARILTPGPVAGGFTLGDSLTYWKNAKLTEDFVDAYDNGRIDQAASAGEQLLQSFH